MIPKKTISTFPPELLLCSCLSSPENAFKKDKVISPPDSNPQPKVHTKKEVATYSVTTSFKWASLGLNQGPPDYESVALTN